jgi:hypothetical protein
MTICSQLEQLRTSDLEKPPQYFGIASAKKKKQKRDMNEGSGDDTMFLPSSK